MGLQAPIGTEFAQFLKALDRLVSALKCDRGPPGGCLGTFHCTGRAIF